jgi:hypothetical protein
MVQMAVMVALVAAQDMEHLLVVAGIRQAHLRRKEIMVVIHQALVRLILLVLVVVEQEQPEEMLRVRRLELEVMVQHRQFLDHL